jgi:DNA-binding IclR family transcriptional regulator
VNTTTDFAPDMSAALERSFQVLERLAVAPEGRSLSSLSQELDMPLSATHRVLTDLCRMGYVRQNQEQGVYALTIKLASLGLGFLSSSGVVDVAQPLLDDLAKASGELVRLAVVDGDELVFVAKAQGATRGLRYDPDMGLSVRLSCSAAGHAWLSTMSEDQALELVSKQGLGKPEDFGPKAPTTIKGVMTYVKAARKRGFSMIVEVFAPGMTAMGAPVRRPDGRAIGVMTIAGPLVRLTEQRMLELGPVLMATAAQVADASHASGLFRRHAA